MAGVAQVWLTEDELDFLVKAAVQYIPLLPPPSREIAPVRQAVLDKLRPLVHGTSCDVASGGGCSLELDTKRREAAIQEVYDRIKPVMGAPDDTADGHELAWLRAEKAVGR